MVLFGLLQELERGALFTFKELMYYYGELREEFIATTNLQNHFLEI